MDDPLVRTYDASEREIAAEFLTDWLPFLSQDLCDHCSAGIRRRISSLRTGTSSSLQLEQVEPAREHHATEMSNASNGITQSSWDPVPESSFSQINITSSGWDLDQQHSNETVHIIPSGWDLDPEPCIPITPTGLDLGPVTKSTRTRASWADMAQEEDELEEIEEEARLRREQEDRGEKGKWKMELTREQKELNRFRNVKRNKEFMCLERVGGRIVNIVEGLELHTGVFSPVEQKRIVDFINELQEKGRNGELGERTYSAPNKWMKGKGRVTMQFGCNYNYSTDRNGNPPGIIDAPADPLPNLFKIIIRRLIKWQVLPTTCVPDSCIVNVYESGDCIPPHIDSHDFVRPFCTISFLSECEILFGSNLKIVGPGEFAGSFAIPLPVGSVLVLNGNGADIAKHCIPAVPTKRISVTFRKMERSKWPAGFALEPDLQNIVPLSYYSNSVHDKKDKGENLELENFSEIGNLSSNVKSKISEVESFSKSQNSNSSRYFRGGRRSRGKAPMIRNLYRSPQPPSTSNHVVTSNGSTERERFSLDGNGEERTPNGQRVLFDQSATPSSINEGIKDLTIGNNGSEQSKQGWTSSRNYRRRNGRTT